jgi:hypothetical protein
VRGTGPAVSLIEALYIRVRALTAAEVGGGEGLHGFAVLDKLHVGTTTAGLEPVSDAIRTNHNRPMAQKGVYG